MQYPRELGDGIQFVKFLPAVNSVVFFFCFFFAFFAFVLSTLTGRARTIFYACLSHLVMFPIQGEFGDTGSKGADGPKVLSLFSMWYCLWICDVSLLPHLAIVLVLETVDC